MAISIMGMLIATQLRTSLLMVPRQIVLRIIRATICTSKILRAKPKYLVIVTQMIFSRMLVESLKALQELLIRRTLRSIIAV